MSAVRKKPQEIPESDPLRRLFILIDGDKRYGVLGIRKRLKRLELMVFVLLLERIALARISPDGDSLIAWLISLILG